jgi:diphthamide biosynthesis protein 2
MKEKFSTNENVYISNIEMDNSQIQTTTRDKKILFSRVLPNDVRNDEYSFFYIGSKETFLNPFLFYFNKKKFFNYDPKNNSAQPTQPILFSKTNKELMKRYYLIEKARDSRIFGILVGTMSVANYKEAIDHVSSLLKKASRRYYSFLIGKLNCPKLNNFMEIDMYVLVACNENSLINSKELNKPIITIYELEIAFNCARLWGEEFICDFRQLLPGGEHYIPTEISQEESDTSLITGRTRVMNMNELNELKNESSLMRKEDALSVMHYSGAGNKLHYML